MSICNQTCAAASMFFLIGLKLITVGLIWRDQGNRVIYLFFSLFMVESRWFLLDGIKLWKQYEVFNFSGWLRLKAQGFCNLTLVYLITFMPCQWKSSLEINCVVFKKKWLAERWQHLTSIKHCEGRCENITSKAEIITPRQTKFRHSCFHENQEHPAFPHSIRCHW